MYNCIGGVFQRHARRKSNDKDPLSFAYGARLPSGHGLGHRRGHRPIEANQSPVVAIGVTDAAAFACQNRVSAKDVTRWDRGRVGIRLLQQIAKYKFDFGDMFWSA